jgi:hypothetical protein
MFFYFLKIIFKINVSKQSKIYNFFLIFNKKKKHLNFLNRQCQSELCTCSSLLYTYVMYSIFRQFKIRTDNSFYFCAGKHVVGTQETRQQKGWYYETRSFFSKNSASVKRAYVNQASVKSMNSFFFFFFLYLLQLRLQLRIEIELRHGRGGEGNVALNAE